ncbi:hypothetical protein RE428_48990 (plasmid) [Marinobacter nanhaiticus D15-8W]|nr:hypothetical protein RE428_48990 [Marinobacter nanhaiticus D15-8W]
MKLNYRHPKTGKPSTVNLPDHWVDLYLTVVVESGKEDADLSCSKKRATVELLAWCVDKYFDPTTRPTKKLPDPSDCTLTSYCEAYMASAIKDRYLIKTGG